MPDVSVDELAADVAATAADLSLKVREAVLAGNSHDAVEWSGALRDTAAAYRDLMELVERD